MPEIPMINADVLPQGEEVAHRQMARPNDFGSQVGDAFLGLGDQMGRSADIVERVNEQEDMTNLQVNMAKAREQWTQELQNRADSAQPGDQSFAEKLMSDMHDYFGQFSDSVTTPAGKREFTALSANMMSEFGQRAVAIQGELAAKAAQNKYVDLSQSLGNTVYKDPSQLGSSLKQATAAIDNPNGIFARVPQTTRDELKEKITNDLTFAAHKNIAENNPDAVLEAVGPNKLKLFKPYERILQDNAVPSAIVNISPKTMAIAPDVLPIASAKGVNGNVALAQFDVSGKKPNKDAIASQVSAMQVLLKAYGNDYTKALAAYKMGAPELDSLMHLHGNDWQNYLPADIQQYVGSVMDKAGRVAPQTNPGEPTTKPPMYETPTTGEPPINGLTWQQNDSLVNTAVRSKLLAMAIQERQMELSDKEQSEASKASMDKYVQQITEPTQYGKFDMKAAMADPSISWQQKRDLVDYTTTHIRGAATMPHPDAVRRLMLEIHAPDNDPTKVYTMDPINQAYKDGQLNVNEYRLLRNEVAQMKDGTTNPFYKKVNQARNLVYESLMRSYLAAGQPGKAADAAYRFNFDLDNKINEYRKEGKDPSSLLDPTSRDYMLKPEIIQSYLQQPKVSLGEDAAKTIEAGKNDRTAATGFVIDKQYRVNGLVRKYLGGPINLSTSWQVVGQ